MYENSYRIAKKLEAIADEIDSDERFEFDDNAESCFMESVETICREQYEMILMYANHLKEEKLAKNDLATIRKK